MSTPPATVHVAYEVRQHVSAQTIPVTHARLTLPNGEVKIPHGGLCLLVEVDSERPGAIRVHDKAVRIAGRAVVRSAVKTSTGTFHLGLHKAGQRPVHCTLPVSFAGGRHIPSFQAFREAWEVEFVVSDSRAPSWQTMLDQSLMEKPRDPGEISLEELVDLLGGPVDDSSVGFTSEGGLVVR